MLRNKLKILHNSSGGFDKKYQIAIRTVDRNLANRRLKNPNLLIMQTLKYQISFQPMQFFIGLKFNQDPTEQAQHS